ncbi:MAG: hypothetical protein KAX38_06870, partial [Candidatus Krumholzibacteria bacterium]|nr:hypothetical protein [Candidatus Krumholzibacteria bacterium]
MKGERDSEMNRLITSTLIIILMLISCGEKERIIEVEVPVNCKPSPPGGVTVFNLNGSVTICWYPNFEPEDDIVCYDVYRAVEYDTTYNYIGTVDAESPDPYEYCLNYETDNGIQFYYAVVAVDKGGRESELSLEEVTGTPRPENKITLREHREIPAQSGYDFSSLTNTPQMDSLPSTDIY